MSYRGGSLGLWVQRGGVPAVGVGSTTVPEEGGEEREAVVDQTVPLPGGSIAVRGPFESSTAGDGEVRVEAVLHESRILLPGLDLWVEHAHATAVVRCLADGSVTARTETTLGRATLNGAPLAIGPQEQGALGATVLVEEQVVDEESGDARATSLRIAVGGDVVTLAQVHAGLDCLPADEETWAS